MTLEIITTFTCDYDGVDTVSVSGPTITDTPPAPWYYTTQPRSGGDLGRTYYWHNQTHAEQGTGGVLGGIYQGGRTLSWKYTDDHDGTIAQIPMVDYLQDGELPIGWVTLKHGGVTYHFKSEANASAWIGANP